MKFIYLLMLISANVFAEQVNLSSLTNNKPLIVIDKKHAQLFYIDSNNENVVASPVLLGQQVADTLSSSTKITPSGEFELQKVYSSRMKSTILTFYRTTNFVIAIHPIPSSNKQHRFERLNSLNIDDRRITNGCVNVSYEIFDSIFTMIPDHTRLVILKEAQELNDDLSNKKLL